MNSSGANYLGAIGYALSDLGFGPDLWRDMTISGVSQLALGLLNHSRAGRGVTPPGPFGGIEANEAVPLATVMESAADKGPRAERGGRVPAVTVKPDTPANVAPVDDAASVTSAVGPAPAPAPTSAGAAPPKRAVDNE